MRITNDCPPDAMLAELFSANVVVIQETVVFADPSLANHDEVCDRFKDRVDVILRSYTRLGNEVHVTQSMRDNGVDILLEFVGQNGAAKRIGIQVKSNYEAIRATKENRSGESMEAVLKRQAFESLRWRLDEWWVVLCFDLTVPAHTKLIKRINSELLQGIHPKIRIYEPTNAWSFLSMHEDEIDALCVLALCRDDEILIAARSEVSQLSTKAFRVVMDTLFDSFDDDVLTYSMSQLRELTSEDNTYDISMTTDVLDELNFYLIRVDYEDVWRVNRYYFEGLFALYFEGKVRHQLSHAGAANFVRKLMSAR